MATELYNTMIAAIHAHQADDMNVDKLNALEAAEAAYYGKRAELRAQWNAIPESDNKASAEENANDTEGTDIDTLYWFEIALRSYELL